LIGLGATVTIAGCSDTNRSESEPETESGSENETQNETEVEETVDEPQSNFEITEAVDGNTFSDNTDHPIDVTIKNTGEVGGEQSVEIVSKNETTTQQIQLEPEEETEITVSFVNALEVEPGEYEYTVRTNNDEINAGYTVVDPLENAISKAKNQYRRALANFGNNTDVEDGTFMHVYPSTKFTNDQINRELDTLGRAGEIMSEEGLEYAQNDSERNRVREIGSYEELIKELARIQRDIHSAYTVFGPIEGNSAYDRDQIERARSKHDELESEMQKNQLYIEELETKYNQLEWQIEQVENTFDGLQNLTNAAEPSLLTPTQLQVALDDFEKVIDELEDESSAPPEDITDEEFLDQVEEFYEVTDEALNEVTLG
jgi:hypothetical protein